MAWRIKKERIVIMKKLFITALCITAAVCKAQVAGLPQNVDTVVGQRVGFYYSDYYTRCSTFKRPLPFNTQKINFEQVEMKNPSNILAASEHFTPHPVAVRGLAALVVIDTAEILYRRSVILDGTTLTPVGDSLRLTKVPETLLLFQVTDTATYRVRLVDSVRWDTAAPRWLMLPLSAQAMQSGDTAQMARCCLYEAYLPEPVVVDSFFYVAGTSRSNIGTQPLGYEYTIPTVYSPLRETMVDNPCFSCLSPYRILFNHEPLDRIWTTEIYDTVVEYGETNYITVASSMNNFYNATLGDYNIATGPFYAILDSDYYQLTVLSDNETMGTVYGGGHYTAMVTATIGATPKHGYRFAQWADGNTDNPRSVSIHCDTAFTAQFTLENNCYVHVAPNNTAWGSTTGSGYHPKNEPLTITASAVGETSWFIGWADGATDNPRVVVPEDDTAFIAIFASTERITGAEDIAFSLTPNPAHGSVTLATNAEGNYSVVIFDDAGHLVLKHSFSGKTTTIDIKSLPSGHYVAIISDMKNTGVKSFIKQ